MSRHPLDPGGDATSASREARINRALATIARDFGGQPTPGVTPLNRHALLAHIMDGIHWLKYATNAELAEVSAILEAIEHRRQS